MKSLKPGRGRPFLNNFLYHFLEDFGFLGYDIVTNAVFKLSNDCRLVPVHLLQVAPTENEWRRSPLAQRLYGTTSKMKEANGAKERKKRCALPALQTKIPVLMKIFYMYIGSNVEIP